MRLINYTKTTLFVASLLWIIACKNANNSNIAASTENLAPPSTAKIVKEFDEYGSKRLDEYFWLNNAQDTNVIKHLNAENEYTAKMLAHTEGLQNKLYGEMVARVEQTSQTVPVKENGFWYYNRFEEGKEYPLMCRKKTDWNAPEEIILDVPNLAKGYKLYRLFERSVSPNNSILAYLVDTSGDRRNTLYFKDLVSGRLLNDKISDVANGGIIWTNDGKHIYYILNDKTVRGYKVMCHAIGTNALSDKVVFTENDNTYAVSIYKSQSKKYIFIASHSTTTDETRYLDASNVNIPLRTFYPRERNLEYNVNHYEDGDFYIYNNHNARNFKLSKTSVSNTGLKNWKDVVTHSDSSYLMGFEVLKKYILIQDKVKGLNKIRIIDRSNNNMEEVNLGEDAYLADMQLSDLDNFDLDSIRYSYSSLTTPNSTFLYDIKTKTKTILRQDKVLGFNTSEYQTKRLWVKTRDSIEVPLSIVYKKQLFKQDGTNPLFMYAYGSYGYSTDPNFRQDVVSLLDRGFVYVIVHVRGGQELGRAWYEDGKLLKKKNTFNDFVDAAEYLIKEKYTSSSRLFANGGSAGGMLMGAIINQKPELWRGVIPEVPWMDVITDMFNADLPLTTLEYDEWGDPRKKEYYDYMLSWSPYDNVKKANYPAILSTGGLNDTQVPYFSPAKWVARVRDNNTGKNPILFKCNMGAGHGGQSGRFDRYKLTALKYAFVLDCVNIKD